MEIIYVHKANFHQRPPVISAVLALTDLGHHVHLITEGINDYWMQKLAVRGVELNVILNVKSTGKLSKLYSYYNFKKEVEKYISSIPNGFLWVEGGQTIFCLESILKRHRFILQIQELYETSRLFYRSISRVINKSLRVFVPEYHRAVLYQCWFGMKERPIILPNKPYFTPSVSELKSLERKYQIQLGQVTSKKSILYQGHIGPERDLTNYIKAVKELGPEYQVVLVGQNHANYVERYKQLDESIIHIDYLPAPDYLLFTSYAYIGIISYDVDSLNNIFCAPNKIWEYSGFGLPVVCNDIPGLKSVEMAGAGICVNEHIVDEIMSAIKKIDSNYAQYSSRALGMYNSQDNKAIIKEALSKL